MAIDQEFIGTLDLVARLEQKTRGEQELRPAEFVHKYGHHPFGKSKYNGHMPDDNDPFDDDDTPPDNDSDDSDDTPSKTAVQLAGSVLKASQVKTKDIKWLAYPYFPAGKVVGAEGESELGKTMVLIDLMARVTRGSPFPNGERTKPSSVIYISFEDDPEDTIIPRLVKAGADLDKVFIIYMLDDEEGTRFFNIGIKADVELLRSTIDENSAVLVVIDPITQALGGKTDAYKETDVRKALAPLMKMAQETGACIVNVRHHKKGKSDSMKEQGIGSGGFFNIPRSVIGFYTDSTDETEKTKLFVHKKCSIAEHAKPHKYRIVGSRTVTPSVQWLGVSDQTNRQILEGASRTGQLNKDIIAILNVAPDNCMKTADIKLYAVGLGHSESSVYSTLSRMVGKELKKDTARGTHCLKLGAA